MTIIVNALPSKGRAAPGNFESRVKCEHKVELIIFYSIYFTFLNNNNDII